MDKYTLIRVSADNEQEIRKFDAPDVIAACRVHLQEWGRRTTSHAVVLCMPNGARHSYHDSKCRIEDGAPLSSELV